MRLLPLLLVAATLSAQPAARRSLMPWPAEIEPGQGSLAIVSPIRIQLTGYSEPRLLDAIRRVGEIAAPGSPAILVIQCDHASQSVQQLGEDESYRLQITSEQARLSAPNLLGVLRGLETFRQLIDSSPNSLEAVDIHDHPRFPWRGLHLDVARHWMPVEVVKRNLDGMAAVKLNVFHWHLSDDQGFRVESKRFPKLQQMGSDGLFYTQEQIRDVIEYARNRGIRVIPEFDVPGHTTSWLVGYPELASAPGPYKIERQWGVFDPTMDPTRDSTYEFLDAFIAEMAALFPDPFFHVGGDEVTGVQWKNSPRIRAFMRKNNLKDVQELHSYFNRRLQKIVAKHGKRMEGWDEILDPDLPKDIVIQSWRGQKSLAEAARHGFSGILSWGYYLDHMEPASKLYGVDPLGGDAASLGDEEKSRILGGEIAMWGEFVSPENVDSRIWPRAAAVAERFWSPRGVADVTDMYRRLAEVSRELDQRGLKLNFHYPSESIKTLADILEPATFAQRIRTHKYNQQTPLTGLVDMVRPDSETARKFAALVDRPSGQMDRALIRMWLTRWRNNNVPIEPAATVRRLCSVGLEALDYLDRGQHPSSGWLSEERAFLETVKKPQAELRIAIVPSIEKLVAATASAP